MSVPDSVSHFKFYKTASHVCTFKTLLLIFYSTFLVMRKFFMFYVNKMELDDIYNTVGPQLSAVFEAKI